VQLEPQPDFVERVFYMTSIKYKCVTNPMAWCFFGEGTPSCTPSGICETWKTIALDSDQALDLSLLRTVFSISNYLFEMMKNFQNSSYNYIYNKYLIKAFILNSQETVNLIEFMSCENN
jgi:hypothetical protein